MKKLRTVLLTTTMACAMTTGVFAANCPTAPKTQNTTPVTRQLQVRNLSNCINNLDCKNINLSDLCKDMNIEDVYAKIIKSQTNCDSKDLNNCNFDGFKFGKRVRSNQKDNSNKKIETQKPETQKPETQKPETQKPETQKPETQKPETQKPSNEESKTDLTESQFASEVVRLVNVEREKAGLNPLTADSTIQKAAYVRSMEQKQLFSHTRPNGSSCFTALDEEGVSYRGAGENIAMGQKTPADVMKAWMNSDGHRANILNKNFTHIGVGYYTNNGTAYWTQLFTY